MKLSPHQKSVIRNRRRNGIKRTERIINGIDDFLSRLAALKEQNNLIIGGIRIC